MNRKEGFFKSLNNVSNNNDDYFNTYVNKTSDNSASVAIRSLSNNKKKEISFIFDKNRRFFTIINNDSREKYEIVNFDELLEDLHDLALNGTKNLLIETNKKERFVIQILEFIESEYDRDEINDLTRKAQYIIRRSSDINSKLIIDSTKFRPIELYLELDILHKLLK